MDENAIYNIIRVHALMNNPAEALEYLSLKRKYLTGQYINVAKWDSDLDNIRSDPRFKKYLSDETIRFENNTKSQK